MSELETLTEQELQESGLLEHPNESVVADASYAQSDCHYWNDVKLEPFSSRRQIAANCLGLRFGNLSEDEMQSGLEGRGYPDLMQDAIIILYLCYPRGKDESIEESYAACDPVQRKNVRKRMLQWAEAQGIEMCSPTLAKASQVMSSILKEEIINRFKLPAPKGAKPSGNS